MDNTGWTTHTDGEGDEETEVHQVRLELLIIEVAKQKGHKLWTGSVMTTANADIVGRQVYDHDPEHCKVQVMVKAMKLLESDGKVLADVMLGMNLKPSSS